jgi:hypothetical protein
MWTWLKRALDVRPPLPGVLYMEDRQPLEVLHNGQWVEGYFVDAALDGHYAVRLKSDPHTKWRKTALELKMPADGKR